MTPDQYTNQELSLDVGDGHTLYIQDWGKADAKEPIIFLHGGPGGGVKDKYRQQFEPNVQRVIFFDQRGCGKSTPNGSLENNTTQDLVEDIEKIAKHLKLEKFIITGGSWGSCLALAYGLKYPERVIAMVLRGIFTGRQSETDWIEKGGYKTFFPNVWDTYVAGTPAEYSENPSAYHVPRILGEDSQASRESAYLYGNVENSLLSLDDRFTPDKFESEDFDPTISVLEAHYLSQTCFMPDGYIIEKAPQLTMPIWLIQGRYDMVCPPITAYELDKRLPNSHLIWTTAGHGNDRPNYDVNRTILLQMVSP